MGGIGKILGGGGSKSTSTSGYSALPYELRQGFDSIGKQIGAYTDPSKAGVINRFTPMAQTADETAAFDRMRTGFAPTAQSLQSDISMLMNPYNEHVINQVNRQAQGDYSILKQAGQEAGQLGSNRQLLGANDIEQTRLGTIGQLQQNQYNQALGQVFNNLIPQRQQDVQNLLGIGGFQRGLQSSTNLAPISALQAGTGLMAPFVGGGSSTQTSGGSGMLGGLGQLAGGIGGLMQGAGGAASLASLFATSDIRLKEHIIPKGKENGHNIYEFSYKNDRTGKRYIGVMAHEVPDAAVMLPDGYYAVDYSKIGVEFREVNHG